MLTMTSMLRREEVSETSGVVEEILEDESSEMAMAATMLQVSTTTNL